MSTTPETTQDPAGYTWCGMCGYNAKVTDESELNRINAEQVHCPWCDEVGGFSFLGAGTAQEMEDAAVCPDEPMMTWPETDPEKATL